MSLYFYRPMLGGARLWHSKLSVRPSVCLSVTFRYVFRTSWNTSKIISRPNTCSQWPMGDRSNGNIPQRRVEYWWGQDHKNLQYFRTDARWEWDQGCYDAL